MVQAVRSGLSLRETARRFQVSVSTVSHWVERARGRRLDRMDFTDRPRGPRRPWNRTPTRLEQRILRLRRELREDSILGEYGARVIQGALQDSANPAPVPSLATINRVLARHGAFDGVHRVRRPPPPKGWYLPAVAASQAELDCFDFIEDLKIAAGPLVNMFTGTSLHGGQVDAWVQQHRSAKTTVNCLQKRWQRDSLPAYAQFDNDTVFQGAHQFADSIGRVSRLCLALHLIPVFVPPREPGFQNAIEGFNGLWQSKLWQRVPVRNARDLQRHSDRYVAAHRGRNARRRELAPARRPFPKGFRFNPKAPLRGTIIFLRRTDARGRVQLLGRTFTVSNAWLHRLVRCEVDLTRHRIHCYALRRRAPEDQPLLASIRYHRIDKPFKGDV